MEYIRITSSLNQMIVTLNASALARITCNLQLTGVDGQTDCNCGHRNAPRQSRVVNGTSIIPNEYPSLVYVAGKVDNKALACSGSISK